MPSVLRILDANANRAREALRVMEDAARFLLDDADLTAALKDLRHDLAAALARIPGGVEISRDTPGDVGVAIKAPSELTRGSVAEVALAAGKRLSEALRVLEEFGKTLPAAGAEGSGSFAAVIESLRYRGYEVERRLNQALAAGRPGRQWRLCVLVSAELCPQGDWLGVAGAALAGGADALQLREKALDAGELLARARQLVSLCRRHGASLIVNDRPDVALLAGADGVHLGQTDLPCRAARQLVGRQLLLGVSTSTLAQARQAAADGADYCGVGPMFPTTTKHKDVIVGPAYLRAFVANFPALPHLAIGGIHAGNLGALVAAGARGVAVSSAVCAAPDPQAAAAELLALLPPA
jgi:thiamine-phosphate pyrophosphorylase